MSDDMRVGQNVGQVQSEIDEGNFDDLFAEVDGAEKKAEAGESEENKMTEGDKQVMDSVVNQMIADTSVQNMQKQQRKQKEMFDE
ncbi:MAG: hypothetical protein OXC07_09730 [Kistimonas sp.]|nr:hypothetical protein [Kistimonas sp.]